MVFQQTSNPSYGKAVNGWLQDHVWPPSDTTKVDAGVLLPQERDNSGTIHKYLCGRGFFEVLGIYDQTSKRIINASIKFIVPFFGPIPFISGYTASVDSEPPVRIPVRYGPINGFVVLGMYKPEAKVDKQQEPQIALSYELDTPYGDLNDTVPLFPADASASLSSRVWYQNVPIMHDSFIESCQATPNSQVERNTRATSNRRKTYATLKTMNVTGPSKEQDIKLLERFLRDFATKKDNDNKIIIPATPIPYRLNDAGDVVAPVEKQRTVRAQFHEQFRLVGSINLETLFINAVMLISIPITGNTQTCQVAGSLTNIAGVVVLLNEPLVNGIVNFSYDDQGSKAYLTVTTKVELALVGPVKLVDYPLVELPSKYALVPS